MSLVPANIVVFGFSPLQLFLFAFDPCTIKKSLLFIPNVIWTLKTFLKLTKGHVGQYKRATWIHFMIFNLFLAALQFNK